MTKMTISPDIKARFAASMLKFVAAVKIESETCAELCGNLNEKELLVTVFVGENNDVKMSDIAENLRAPLNTITSIVDKLVEKQFLARVHSAQDRRVINVMLQNKGKTAFRQFQKRKEELTQRVLGMYTVEEQIAFVDYLNRMSTVIGSMK